jgi:zinc protease
LTGRRTSAAGGGAIAAGKFPSIQRATLSNGLMVMLVERHEAPLVSVELLVNTAYAEDYAQPGGHRWSRREPDGRRHDDRVR